MSEAARWTITRAGEALQGRSFDVLGQRVVPKISTPDLLVLEMPMSRGQFVPVHFHPDHAETLTLLQGRLRLKLDGAWQPVEAGDVVHIPRRVPHGLLNDADEDAVVMLVNTPAGQTMQMLDRLQGASDTAEVLDALESCGMVLLGGDADE